MMKMHEQKESTENSSLAAQDGEVTKPEADATSVGSDASMQDFRS